MRPRRTPAELRIVDRDRAVSLFRLWEPPDVTDEEIAVVDEPAKEGRPVVFRRTKEQLKLTDRDRADRRIRENMGLIVETLKREFPWSVFAARGLWERLLSVAMWSVAKADRDYDETRGEFSTVATKYIVNDVLKHEKRRRRHLGRMKSCDLDHAVQSREMRPDKAAETWEVVRRNTPVEMFGEE